MPIQGQLNVHALNDGFTALDSVAAMSQSGRFLSDDFPRTCRWIVVIGKSIAIVGLSVNAGLKPSIAAGRLPETQFNAIA
jgi:hypothetical protein